MSNINSSRRECILVSCPECGAFRGSQCRNLAGAKLTGGKFHMGRARKFGPSKYGRKAKAA